MPFVSAVDAFLQKLQDKNASSTALIASCQAIFDATLGGGTTLEMAKDALYRIADALEGLREVERIILCTQACQTLATSNIREERAGLALAAAMPHFLMPAVALRERLNSYQEIEPELPDQMLAYAITQNPQGLVALNNMENTCSKAIWLWSRSRAARDRARAEGVPGLARRVSERSPMARWLALLLEVPEEEELVILDPAAKKGFRVHIERIADNTQLQVLLADALCGEGEEKLFGQRPPAQVLAVFAGEGPQAIEGEQASGNWNLYNWTGLLPEKTLPRGGLFFDALFANIKIEGLSAPAQTTPSDDGRHWIWSEGKPSDIAALNGERVLLIGPPAYNRTWNCSRLFADLKPSLQVKEPLTRAQVEEYLEAIVAAQKTEAFARLEVKAYAQQASVAEGTSNLENAMKLREAALKAAEDLLGPESAEAADSLYWLARIALSLKDEARAEALAKQALLIREKVFGPDHPLVAESIEQVLASISSRFQLEEMAPLAKRAALIWEKSGNATKLATTHQMLGMLYESMNQIEASLPYRELWLKDLEALVGEHPKTTKALEAVFGNLYLLGRLEESLAPLRRCVEMSGLFYGVEHPDFARRVQNLALVLEKLGRHEEAKQYREKLD